MSQAPKELAIERVEQLARARHLKDTILAQAKEKGHSASDIARALDVSLGHWYRLSREPQRLKSIEFQRVRSIAKYIGWPIGQVIVSIGWLRQAELGADFAADAVVGRTLKRLMREAVASGVTTPLTAASRDHQVLMARLMLAAESATIEGPASRKKGLHRQSRD